jgi:hypothetical protein
MLKILVLPILIHFQQMPVTFTGIDYIPAGDSVKVSIRYNYDLFLRDYQQTINDDLDLNVLRSYRPFPSDLINNYINSKVHIFGNKKLLVGKLLENGTDGNDIRLVLLYRPEKKLRSITIRNTILTGLFSDVENLTILKMNNIEKEIIFTSSHNEETIPLK